MKRFRGNTISGLLRVVMFVGLPASIGIGASRLAIARSDAR
jgi:hypothetical protein